MTHPLFSPSHLSPANVSRHARTLHLSPAPRRLGGFSLVELMVAIVISSLLLIGVVEIFINSRESYQLDEGLSRVQESGRFATDFLDRAVRMAGNMGCLANIKPGNIDNYLVGGGGAPFDITRGIEGFEANGTSPGQTYILAASYPFVALSSTNNWTPALNTGLLPVGQAVPGSDILVVRSLSTSATAVASNNSTANVVVKQPNFLVGGQIVMLTDCERVAIFQINSTSGGSGPTTITHTPAGSIGNICSVWGSPQCPQGRIFTNGAEVGVLQVSVFYVGRGADGTSSLFEQRFDAGVPQVQPNELVSGIENMQVLYGVDTDADKPAGKPSHNADTYLPANLVTDWTRVVSARISLLARTYNVDRTAVDTTQDLSTYNLADTLIKPVANANDKQRRRVFNVTIKLRNR